MRIHGARMSLQHLVGGAIAALLLAGCAHNIKIAPDVTKVERTSAAPPRIEKKVGYYIPPDVSSVEITTQGGGSNDLRYFPYRDIDIGYQKMLGNVFASVVKLTSMADLPSVAHGGIDYVIVPVIITSSGGSGLFAWPPTTFTIDLTSNVRDTAGHLIASPHVIGTGSADTSEGINDHAVAGKRAMEDALLKMQAVLLEARLPNATQDDVPATMQAPTATGAVAARLALLQDLRDRGLITKEEYENKRKAILDAL